MCICTNIYMCACTDIYRYRYAYVQTLVDLDVYICVNGYRCMHTCMWICVYATGDSARHECAGINAHTHAHSYVYLYLYLSIYSCISVCMHTYI